jgi:DNA-binding transcriptional MerR regulator
MTSIVVDDTYSISEVAERTGVTSHAIRYYERIGLLDVGRRPGGQRGFTPLDVDRVIFIGRLRATEMPIRDIQRYFALVAEGDATEQERLAMLVAHRVAVGARMRELEVALGAIEHKIVNYKANCGPG